MSTLSFTAQQLYNMLTDAHCNCKQYISVDQNGLLILANESRNSYGVFEDIPVTKDFIIEYDLTLGSNSNPCCNPTFGSYIKPNSAQYYGFMLSFSEGGELWRGENNSPSTSQQSLGMSSTAWYGTPNTTYHIKIERDDNTVNLYVDNVLTQTISDNSILTTEGGYFGFFNWDGYTCKISNVTVTSDTYSNIKKYVNGTGLSEAWTNIKNYITAQLLGKSNTGHTHTKSEITDFPTIPTKTSDLTNDSGFLTSHQDLSGYVPRSGGAVMTDYFLGRSADTGSFMLNGGTAWDKGGSIELFGANNNDSYHQGSVRIQPAKNNTTYKKMELLPNGTWTWTGSACAVSSDSRLKDEIESIPDEILDAWENLEPKQYKLKSELETDKKNAQVHYGWVAQDVESVIKGNRKGSVKNGLWLHEEWGEQKEVSHEETYTEEVETKSGEKQTVTKTRKVIDQPYRAKGDSYGLRYTECLVVECKYLRRCIARLTARIEELEKGNNIK